MEIRRYQDSDEASVVRLWTECGLVKSWNDPHKDICRKLTVQPELFLVGVLHGSIVATIMAGFDGHRGWVNYLAVAEQHRRRGLGRMLMQQVESQLKNMGCPKLNLQVRSSNAAVLAFYQRLGYARDEAVSLGKRLISDESASTIDSRDMTSQKGCYANVLGECADGMSREHYFSRAMTDAIPGRKFNIGGFPWQKPGELTTLTPDALVAKILCGRHNAALSPLDSTAGSFFKTVYACTRGGIQGQIPLDDLCFEFDGRALERWLLKVLCGVSASGNHSGGNRIVPKEWVEILYDRRPWPKEFEFYLLDRASYTVPLHDHFKFEFYRKGPQDPIEGVTCYFMWYHMSLSLGQYTGFPGIRRTSSRMSFGLKHDERVLEVKLRWP